MKIESRNTFTFSPKDLTSIQFTLKAPREPYRTMADMTDGLREAAETELVVSGCYSPNGWDAEIIRDGGIITVTLTPMESDED